MTKNKAMAYGQQIHARLNDAGWKLEAIKPETRWFAIEHRLFVSKRQAFGEGIYISFMIDPHCEATKTVWSIRAGTNTPTYFYQTEGEIAELYMSRGMFAEKLDAFMDAINKCRNEVHARTQKEEA